MSGFDVDLTVGLKLGDTGFSSGLASLVSQTRDAGARMGVNIGAGLVRGVAHTRGEIRNAWDKVSGFAGGIGGLGAAMGATALINDANQLDKKYRDFAGRVAMAGKETLRYTDIQKAATAATNKWAAASDQLTQGAFAMWEDTGSAKDAVGAMENVGMISRATGMTIAETSSLVGGLNEQFGITNDQIDDTVAGLLELGGQGGVSIQDISGGMAEIARAAKLAGVEGPDGLKKIIALSNQLEGAAGGGSQAISMMSTVLSRLAANPALHKELKQKFGIDAKGKDAVGLLGEILAKNKGKETQALGELFKAGDAVKLAQAFGDGGFGSALASANTKTTGRDLRTKAEENMKAPAAQIELALQRLRLAFTQPQVVESLTKLAGSLPPVVDGFAKLASIVADNGTTIATAYATSTLFKFAGGLTAAVGGVEKTGKSADAASKALDAAGTSATSFGSSLQAGIAALAPIAVGLAVDQGMALKQDLADGVPGQSGLEGDLLQNAATQAVWGSKGGPTTFTDESGNEHIISPYFDPDTGQISYDDMSTVGGAEPIYGNARTDKNGGLIDEMLAESAKATEEAQAARKRAQTQKTGMEGGLGVLATALAGNDKVMNFLGFGSAKGSSSSGPQEVKTPELVGLLRGGIVVSLNPASADAIGAAVAGKVGMPTVKLRTGVGNFDDG